MDGLAGVEFIQGDFTETEVLERLLAALGERRADLVISDMAPNMSGMDAVDQPKAIYLVELEIGRASCRERGWRSGGCGGRLSRRGRERRRSGRGAECIVSGQ